MEDANDYEIEPENQEEYINSIIENYPHLVPSKNDPNPSEEQILKQELFERVKNGEFKINTLIKHTKDLKFLKLPDYEVLK